MNQQHQSLYLVRHAQSEYNLAQMKAVKSEIEVKIEDLGVKFTTDLIDCSISELGRKQVLISTFCIGFN